MIVMWLFFHMNVNDYYYLQKLIFERLLRF